MLILAAAREFGVLPTDIEERMTAKWWRLWLDVKEMSCGQ